MNFEDWFEELQACALDMYGKHVYDLVTKAPFMYEDYFEAKLPVLEALEAEWGN